MRFKLAFFVMLIGVHNVAHADWERVSTDTIRLIGEIDRDSYHEYMKLAGKGYSTLIIKSAGGIPSVALKIAEDVSSRDVAVVVDDYCISACANYLAFSGHQLIVRCNSFLAWHGTLETPEEALVSMRAQHKPEELIVAYVQWLTNFKDRERSFFKKIGVDYRILEDSTRIVNEANITPKPSFNLDELTGNYSVTTSAALWIPTPDILEDYGVNTDGFCERYNSKKIASMLKVNGITMPFTSRGREG